MKTVLATFFVLFLSGWSSFAGDCPVPKPIPCERLKALQAKRCPLEAPVVTIVDHRVEVPVPGPERVVIREVQVPGPERIVTQTIQLAQPKPRGHWLAGVGPVWVHHWGATAVAGYRWPSGWQVQAGPVWLPLDDANGTVTGCRSGEPGLVWAPKCDVPIPFHVESPTPWGAQALVLFTF